MADAEKSSRSGSRIKVRQIRLAAEKGWTPEMLRKCGDFPKTTLLPGTKEYRLPVEAMEDPFKGKPPQNAETEYQNLHKTFYEKLRRILSGNEMKSAGTPPGTPPATPPGSSQSSAGTGARVKSVRQGVGVKVANPGRSVHVPPPKQPTKQG